MWPSPALLCFAGVAVLVMCSSKLDHMTSYFAHIRKSCRLRASFLLISGHVPPFCMTPSTLLRAPHSRNVGRYSQIVSLTRLFFAHIWACSSFLYDTLHIASCSALSQCGQIFANRVAYAPLFCSYLGMS